MDRRISWIALVRSRPFAGGGIPAVPKIRLNGQPTSIPAVLVENRTYARARDLAEAMGATVAWEQADRVVHITTVPVPSPDLDLRLPSNVSPALLDVILAGSGLAGLGPAFAAAEARCRGPNALIAAAHAWLETGGGTSEFFRKRNNLFGIGAWDSDPDRASRFESKQECIDWYADYVTRHYLHPGGRFYHGPTLRGMGKKWATDPLWADKVARIATEMLRKADLIEDG